MNKRESVHSCMRSQNPHDPYKTVVEPTGDRGWDMCVGIHPVAHMRRYCEMQKRKANNQVYKHRL